MGARPSMDTVETSIEVLECTTSHRIMCVMSEQQNLHRPRTKYLDVERANLAYRKQRRRTKV